LFDFIKTTDAGGCSSIKIAKIGAVIVAQTFFAGNAIGTTGTGGAAVVG
jgi:hypothetical protein